MSEQWIYFREGGCVWFFDTEICGVRTEWCNYQSTSDLGLKWPDRSTPLSELDCFELYWIISCSSEGISMTYDPVSTARGALSFHPVIALFCLDYQRK